MKRTLTVIALVIAALVGASLLTDPRVVRAQFIDRIVRPCATGGVPLATVIANPNNNGNVNVIPCTGGSLTVNGVAVVPGPPAACATCVTTTAALTSNRLVIGQSGNAVAAMGSLGTTTTVLHGNAAGAPTFGAVALTTDVSGDLPFANLTPATAASRLLGRGSAAGAGDYQEVTLGSGLAMTGTVLSSAGGVTGSGTVNTVPKFTGVGAIGDSQIQDDGTNIDLDSSGGVTTIGDVGGTANGTKFSVNDAGNIFAFLNGDIDTGGGSLAPSGSGVGGAQVGNTSAPYGAVFIGNAANNSAQITGTFTGNRIATLPNATGTILLDTTAGNLSATTGSIGGGLLAAGTCASGTVAVTGSTTAMTVSVSPNTYPGDGDVWYGYVSSNGTITVKVCAIVALTPTASTYNVRVIR